MLLGPLGVCSFGTLGEGVVAHEHEAYVEVRMRLLDGQHLAPVGRFEETLRFDNHAIRKEEVWSVLRSGDVVELLNLIEESAADLV